jgi:hypothetical protein
VSDFLRLQGGEGAPPLHDHRPFIDPESDNNAAVLPPPTTPPLPPAPPTPGNLFCQS